MTKEQEIQNLKDEVSRLKTMLEERSLAMMSLRSDQVILNELLWLMTKGTCCLKALHDDRFLEFQAYWIPARWRKNDPPSLSAGMRHSYKAVDEAVNPSSFTKNMLRGVLRKVIQEGTPLWAGNEIAMPRLHSGGLT